jgi:hypothetical protein
VKRLILLLALLVQAACAPELPEAPGWGADIKPMLTANCLRCHGSPALGGAPSGFRLDRYAGEDGPLERVQGAREMLEFLQLRAGEGHGDLRDDQRAMLDRWDGDVGEPSPDNHAPVLTVLAPADLPPVRDAILIDYELRDPDFDTVEGALRVDGVVVDDSLHAGRGRAGFSTAAFPEDEVRVEAWFSDGSEVWTQDLGMFATGHDGDISSRVEIVEPRRFALLSDSVPTTIVFRVTDVDSPGPFIGDVRAVRDPLDSSEEPVVIATGFEVPADGAAIPWPTSALPEGALWQLTISVGDASGSGGGASVDRLLVTHATTDDTFTTLADVFARCTPCHDGSRVAGPDLRLESSVRASRAAIHRRAIHLRDMPPRSAELEGLLPLSTAERDRLAAWLLAGAP